MIVQTAVSAIAVCAALSASIADAAQYPKPGSPDPRVRTCVYDEKNPCILTLRPGQEVALKIHPTEQLRLFTLSDAHKNKRVQDELHGNVAILHVSSCLVAEPAYLLSTRADGSIRTYELELRTDPPTCAPPLVSLPASLQPPPEDPNIRTASSGASATDAPSYSTGPLWPANLPRMRTADDLKAERATAAPDGVIYSLSFTYPADAAAARAAARAKQREEERARYTKDLLAQHGGGGSDANQYVGERNHYWARGDEDVKPRSSQPDPSLPGYHPACWDDGYRTSCQFFGKSIPTILKINPDGSPSVPQKAVLDDTIIAAGVAPGWLFMNGDSVAQVANMSYAPAGQPQSLTANPAVELHIRGE